jgi:hypothetical protein
VGRSARWSPATVETPTIPHATSCGWGGQEQLAAGRERLRLGAEPRRAHCERESGRTRATPVTPGTRGRPSICPFRGLTRANLRVTGGRVELVLVGGRGLEASIHFSKSRS